jgi:hypothetical protein
VPESDGAQLRPASELLTVSVPGWQVICEGRLMLCLVASVAARVVCRLLSSSLGIRRDQKVTVTLSLARAVCVDLQRTRAEVTRTCAIVNHVSLSRGADAVQPSGREQPPPPRPENCSTKARTIPLLSWLSWRSVGAKAQCVGAPTRCTRCAGLYLSLFPNMCKSQRPVHGEEGGELFTILKRCFRV